MTLEQAIERRNKLQAAYDALLLGDRVTEFRFEDTNVQYQRGNLSALKTELKNAQKLVAQLSGESVKVRPNKIKHSRGY